MFRKLRGNKKGFSLVELIVVIAIMAVLAAVVVPVTMNYVNKAELESRTTEASGLANAIKNMYMAGETSYTAATIKEYAGEVDFEVVDSAPSDVEIVGRNGEVKYKVFVTVSDTELTTAVVYMPGIKAADAMKYTVTIADGTATVKGETWTK